jgi:hypothetical protein
MVVEGTLLCSHRHRAAESVIPLFAGHDPLHLEHIVMMVMSHFQFNTFSQLPWSILHATLV